MCCGRTTIKSVEPCFSEERLTSRRKGTQGRRWPEQPASARGTSFFSSRIRSLPPKEHLCPHQRRLSANTKQPLLQTVVVVVAADLNTHHRELQLEGRLYLEWVLSAESETHTGMLVRMVRGSLSYSVQSVCSAVSEEIWLHSTPPLLNTCPS